MTTSQTGPTSAVERVARHLAARERLGDEARWGETSPEFRDLYRGAAREVIALMQEPAGEPGGDRGVLRDRITAAIRDAACSGDCGKTEEECAKERIQPFAWRHGRLAVVEGEPEQFADAVLAVLPEPADQATDEVDADTVANRAAQVITAMGAEIRELKHSRGRYRTAWLSARQRAQAFGEGILRHVADRDWWKEQAHAVQAKAEPADRAAVLREAADAVFALEYDVMVGEEGDENMGSMREAWDVGTIHASQLLRRMADETATETAERCAHCGQPIRRITGTLAAWWVHDPGGNTVCDWARPAHSPRATPRTADDTERCAHCNHPKGDHDGRADHRAKHSPLVAGEPWCHACNAPCDHAAAGARQDGAQSPPPPA